MRAQRSNHLHNRNKQGEFEILPNRTYIDGSKHRVADVAVGDEEDGLDEAEEEQLERVDLADENSKGDENCRGTETSFQHSKNQIVKAGVLDSRCGRGCVPFMEGSNPITNSKAVARVIEGPWVTSFFEKFLGGEVITFDHKWLRGVHKVRLKQKPIEPFAEYFLL